MCPKDQRCENCYGNGYERKSDEQTQLLTPVQSCQSSRLCRLCLPFRAIERKDNRNDDKIECSSVLWSENETSETPDLSSGMSTDCPGRDLVVCPAPKTPNPCLTTHGFVDLTRGSSDVSSIRSPSSVPSAHTII